MSKTQNRLKSESKKVILSAFRARSTEVNTSTTGSVFMSDKLLKMVLRVFLHNCFVCVEINTNDFLPAVTTD